MPIVVTHCVQPSVHLSTTIRICHYKLFSTGTDTRQTSHKVCPNKTLIEKGITAAISILTNMVSGYFGPRLFRTGDFGRQSVICDGDFGRCVVKTDGDFRRCAVNSDAAVNSDGDFGRPSLYPLYHYFGIANFAC